jgi:hypothetical protein
MPMPMPMPTPMPTPTPMPNPADSAGCVRTAADYRTHPELWPVKMLVLGGRLYQQSDLANILQPPPGNDASLHLAVPLIAALFNRAAGAGAPPADLALLESAQQWLVDDEPVNRPLPFSVFTGSTAGIQATTLAVGLDLYNSGQAIGAPKACP